MTDSAEIRCLSYITQAPGVVPHAMRTLMGTRLYGCDLFQEVCPHNRRQRETGFAWGRQGAFPFFPAQPLLEPILVMTQKEFAGTVGLTAAGRCGKCTLQRNAVIALGNSGDAGAIPALARVLKNDSRPLLRLHAARALGQPGGPRARCILELQLHRESEPAVARELRPAMEAAHP